MTTFDQLIPGLILLLLLGFFPVAVKIGVQIARRRMPPKARCDMQRCDDPNHSRIHFQKGTGRAYVPSNLMVDSVFRRLDKRREIDALHQAEVAAIPKPLRSPRELGLYD